MADKTLADLMTRHIDAVSPDCSLGDAASVMAKAGISCVLVAENRLPVGIVTERDILRALRNHLARETPVHSVMSAPVLTAPADLDFLGAYHLVCRRGVRHLLITDADGQSLGIVSETDFRFQLGADFLARLSNVAGLMNRQPLAFPAATPLDEALADMADVRASCAFVVDEENRPLGIVTERDTVRLFSRDDDQRPTLGEVMSSPVRAIDPETSLAEAAVHMREERIRHLAVVDAEGRLAGLLDEHDLLRPLEMGNLDRFMDEQKRAEERLRLAASVFEHAHDGIIITDSRGIILEVNTTFTELTGYAREEVLGRNPSLFKSDRHDAAFYAELWRRLTNEGYWRGEVWNRRKNGELYAQLLTISAVHTPEGEISHYVGVFSDITALKESQAQLEHLAYYDALTRLPNRRLLGDRLRLALAQAARDNTLLAVCYLDLDEFKPVNDDFGHAAGDRLLVEVGQRLRDCVRASDTLSRLGGDEFVILLAGIDAFEECERTLTRILSALGAPFEISGHEITLSASIGVTIYPFDGADPDTLLRHADQAMYAAKQGGRNRYSLFDAEHDRRARARREERLRIEAALSAGEFQLHFQPKVDMRQGLVVGAEALIRWRHPERGLLLPEEFLPVVEETDLAASLGQWVLGEALRQMSEWAAAGLVLPVSVNISPRHLQQPDFISRLAALLAAHPKVDPAWLELEILESTALENIPLTSGIIDECRRLGVTFALDDFGTGYSSLTYFRRLSAHTLKIDQSFISDMLNNPDDRAIVEGVIGLTAAFRRQVIAEGVESIEHGTLLMQLGCDLAQGFGIARPMPADRIPDWVRHFKPAPQWADCTGKKRQ